MNPSYAAIRLTASARRAFEKVEKCDWTGGIAIADLLLRVNEFAGAHFPADEVRDGRVSREFSARSLRHYQTLGCIDAPERAGKQVVYGFRNFVQALLVRRLLSERMTSERIVALMTGRSTAETKGMLLEGTETGPRTISEVVGARSMATSGIFGVWQRIPILTGIELHVNHDQPKLTPDQIEQIAELVKTFLRRHR